MPGLPGSIHPFAPLQGPILVEFSFKLLSADSLFRLPAIHKGPKMRETPEKQVGSHGPEPWAKWPRWKPTERVGVIQPGPDSGSSTFRKKKKNVQGRPPQQQQRGITIGVIHTGVSSFHSGVKFRQEFLHCLPITGVGIAVHFLLSWIGVRRPTKKVVLCGHVLIDLRNGTFIAVK